MALVRDRIRPALYDFFGGKMEKHFADYRRKALVHARGRVLEIGGGTGFNLPHYPSTIEELVVTEPVPGMLERARRRAAASALPVTVLAAKAEALPFDDASFDTVVSTLVLCSVDDVDRALAEIHRVLRPGGQLIFVEHVRWEDPERAKWQDRLERPWMALADGCHPNRATLGSIEAGPFDVVEVERTELKQSLPLVRPLVAGRAVARLIVVAFALAALTAAPEAARAHGGTRSTGYVSTFANLDPNVLGVLVNVIGSRELLRVSNYSGETLVVLGYQREPYLRFTRSGVYENSASPTAYLNASRTVPQSVAGNAEPRWKQVARSPSYTWHDHRIVWTGSQPPPAVQESPDETHLIFNWRIPARADGRPFRIKGFLGYSPLPATRDGGGASTWLIVTAAVGCALLLAAAVGAGVRRAKRRTPEAPV